MIDTQIARTRSRLFQFVLEWSSTTMSRWALTRARDPVYIQCRYMAMTTQVSRWGNSLGLRLPKAVARAAQLNEGDTVEVSVENRTIVVKPSQRRYTLDELVSRVTSRNRHDETDWGPRQGHEVW